MCGLSLDWCQGNIYRKPWLSSRNKGFSIWQWQITSWWLACRGYSLTMLNCQWTRFSIHVLSQTWTKPKMNQIESNHTFLLINIPISNLANLYTAASPVNSSGVKKIYHKCNSYLSFKQTETNAGSASPYSNCFLASPICAMWQTHPSTSHGAWHGFPDIFQDSTVSIFGRWCYTYI